MKLRYTVKREHEGCPWKVRARKLKETEEWVLKSCVATHRCKPPSKRLRTTHRQLTSEYLGYKWMKDIGFDPTVKVRFLMRTVKNNLVMKSSMGRHGRQRQMLLGCCMVVMKKHTTSSRGCWARLHIRTRACFMWSRITRECSTVPSGVMDNVWRRFSIVVRSCL